MIYGKLAIAILSTLASSEDGSTNCQIARYLLAHPQGSELSIGELAAQCYVSSSTISRFCREIGLADFSELKALMRDAKWSYEQIVASDAAQRHAALVGSIKSALDQAASSIDNDKLMALCRDIAVYDKVAAFGLLKAGVVAQNLQADLLLMGKIIETKIPFAQQAAYLNRAGRDTLILIFSYSGIYFDTYFSRLPTPEEKPKIVLVTGGKNIKKNRLVDDVMTFESDLGQLGHPYQLLLVSSMIAQGVAHFLKTNAAENAISEI